MIASLSGTITVIKPEYVILQVAGVGYKVAVLPRLISRLTGAGSRLDLFTHQQVREDLLALYGFESEDELELFEQLLSVSGVGPKVAMNIMSAATAPEITRAIINGDATVLTKVSGVGKKIAERVVVELRTKLESSGANIVITTGGSSGDAIDALVSLGYAPYEARQALAAVDATITDTPEQVRAALKLMGKA